jgi:hypothetical protein
MAAAEAKAGVGDAVNAHMTGIERLTIASFLEGLGRGTVRLFAAWYYTNRQED